MKFWQWAFLLSGSMFMLWFSLSILIIALQTYGDGALLLWASGMLALTGMRGLSNFLLMLFAKEEIESD